MQTNAHHTGRAHCDGAPVHYERHRPEQTTLYRLVQQHAQSFFAQSAEAAGARLPQFVRDEFDAFLECGILAHGFLRLRCGDCGHDKLVAFSLRHLGTRLRRPQRALRASPLGSNTARGPLDWGCLRNTHPSRPTSLLRHMDARTRFTTELEEPDCLELRCSSLRKEYDRSY